MKLSPNKISPCKQQPQQQHYQHQGMPPPSGTVGRKATPGGRGSRRGQGGTLRGRKARSTSKGETAAFSQTALEINYQQQQQQLIHQQTIVQPSASTFQGKLRETTV